MPRSLSYESIQFFVKLFAPDNKEAPFSSHDMRAIFQGKVPLDGRCEKFHPKDRYHRLYSDSAPDFALTYTWDTDFRKEMPHFFDSIRKMMDADESEGDEKFNKTFSELTFWLDIFFINQNAEALIDTLVLDSNQIYSSATHHAIFLAPDTLRRGWCLVEIGYRAFAVMSEFRLKIDDLKRLLAGNIKSEKKHFSTKSMRERSESYIVSKSLPCIVVGTATSLVKDLFPYISSEILQDMNTSYPSDRQRILEMLTQLFGSQGEFDKVVHAFAEGAIKLVSEGRVHLPVNADHPCALTLCFATEHESLRPPDRRSACAPDSFSPASKQARPASFRMDAAQRALPPLTIDSPTSDSPRADRSPLSVRSAGSKPPFAGLQAVTP